MRFALQLLDRYHRQLLSLGASLLCALIVHDWYLHSEIAGVKEEAGILVAKLVDLKNEVQRRPTKRLTWQNLRNAESLFEGEQVRTQMDAWARLEIPGGGGFIYVEPSSLISFDRRGDELVLDFLKGNVFVSGAQGTNLKVRADDREIKLNGADLVLEKKAGEKTKAHVTSGTADGVARLEDPFAPLAPVPYATVYVAPGELVAWDWQREIAPGAELKLLTGASRDKLKPTPAKALKGNGLRTRLSPGDYYWQLSAKEKGAEALASQVYFVKVVEKRPVLPLLPEDKAALPFAGVEQSVSFAFENPAGLLGVELEISTSKKFEGVPRAIKITEEGSARVPFTVPGTYYGRYTGKVPGTNEVLLSRVTEFTVQKDETVPVKPELLSPADKAEVKIELGGEVAFSWSPSRATRAYKLKLKHVESGQEKDLVASAPAISVADLAEGNYEWQVVAVGAKSTRREPIELSSSAGAFHLTHALLNPPDYAEGTAEVLTSNARGEAAFAWKPVQKAKAYEVELLDAAGKIVHGGETDATKSSVKKLKPGQYAVRVMAIDAKGRRSPASAPKALVVPNRSDLRAPKLLNVEVDE